MTPRTSKPRIPLDEVFVVRVSDRSIFYSDGTVLPRVAGGSEQTTDAPPADANGVWSAGVVPAPAVTQIPTPPPVNGLPQVMTQDQVIAAIEAARSQERDKLHSRLSKVDEIEAALKVERDARVAREAEVAAAETARQEAETAAAEAARLADMSAVQRVEEVERRFQQELEAERAERQRMTAVLDQERRFQELDSYRTSAIAANQDAIAPQLLDYVQGATREEIDAAIVTAIAKTDAIVESTRASLPGGFSQMAPSPRMAAPTGTPPVGGPMDNASAQTQLTEQDIARMGPAEYAKNRPAILAALSRQVQEKGVYG